jgi:hypothetical protein
MVPKKRQIPILELRRFPFLQGNEEYGFVLGMCRTELDTVPDVVLTSFSLQRVDPAKALSFNH